MTLLDALVRLWCRIAGHRVTLIASSHPATRGRPLVFCARCHKGVPA